MAKIAHQGLGIMTGGDTVLNKHKITGSIDIFIHITFSFTRRGVLYKMKT